MKKKPCFFDTLCLFALFALLFSIGFHLGKEKDEVSDGTVTVTLEIVKIKIPENLDLNGNGTEIRDSQTNGANAADTVLNALQDLEIRIDGKYGCSLTRIGWQTLEFTCKGRRGEAGFLADGAKYITKNQAIELVGKDTYIYGRIRAITPV